jgi:ribosome-binding protein aMBF1 (putative translation factor)
MAKAHSFLWRKPGRRDEERKRFAALMRRVEAVRLRYGMTKTELAAELGANVDGVRAWMSGRTIGRKETVAEAPFQTLAARCQGSSYST